MKRRFFSFTGRITRLHSPRRDIAHDEEVVVLIQISEVGGHRPQNYHDEFDGNGNAGLLLQSGLIFL